MFKAQQRDDVESANEVKVHVTKNGGFYVDADQLMRSSKARKAIAEMQEIFDMEAGCTPSGELGGSNRDSNTSAS